MKEKGGRDSKDDLWYMILLLATYGNACSNSAGT